MNNNNIENSYRHYKNNSNILGMAYSYKNINKLYTQEKSITFYVKEKLPLNSIPVKNIIPDSIIVDGVSYKTDVMVGFDIKAIDGCFEQNTESSSNHRTRQNVLLGGVSISCSPEAMSDRIMAGTLGGFCIDKRDNFLVGLTNAHVIIDRPLIVNTLPDNNLPILKESSIRNQTVMNPASLDGGHIHGDYFGYVKRYYPLFLNKTNYIDAALCTTGRIRTEESKQALNLDFGALYYEFATTEEIDSLIDNDIDLYKSGRSTGANNENCKIKAYSLFTSSPVGNYFVSDGVTGELPFADIILFGFRETALASDNSIVPRENVVVGGDSGSFLIGVFSGQPKIVGVVFASGSSNIEFPNNIGAACRIDRIGETLQIFPWLSNKVNSGNKFIRDWKFKSVDISDFSDIATFIDEENDEENLYWQAGIVKENDTYKALYICTDPPKITISICSKTKAPCETTPQSCETNNFVPCAVSSPPSTQPREPGPPILGNKKRVHISGLLMFDYQLCNWFERPQYSDDNKNFCAGEARFAGDQYPDCDDWVEVGEYPDIRIPFKRAIDTSFDGIAIDKDIKLIIYSGPNFTGDIILDIDGPALINNAVWMRWTHDIPKYIIDYYNLPQHPLNTPEWAQQRKVYNQMKQRPWYPESLNELFPSERRFYSDEVVNLNWRWPDGTAPLWKAYGKDAHVLDVSASDTDAVGPLKQLFAAGNMHFWAGRKNFIWYQPPWPTTDISNQMYGSCKVIDLSEGIS